MIKPHTPEAMAHARKFIRKGIHRQPNARQKLFASYIVAGMKPPEAAEKAGYTNTSKAPAYQRLTNVYVADYMDQLRKEKTGMSEMLTEQVEHVFEVNRQAEEGSVITKEWMIAKLMECHKEAMDNRNYAPALAALKAIAEVSGIMSAPQGDGKAPSRDPNTKLDVTKMNLFLDQFKLLEPPSSGE